jgi:membrane protease subunit HflC
MRAFLAFLVILVGLGAVLVYASAFIVHQNEQALVLRFGDPKRVVQHPGLNWKVPLVDTVEIYDKRILDLDSQPQEVTASDQKRLVVDSFARYRIVDPLKFYQTLRYEDGVRSRLGPIIDSALRRVLGGATFQDVVRDKREELMKRIASHVNQEGADFGLEVVDVRIKRADLPEQNSKSVFDRMRAERQREAAEFRAQGAAEANRIKATADREATVIKAEATRKGEETRGAGDSERNRIYAQAYSKDPEFFEFYRSMQAYENGLRSSDTRMLLSPDSEFFRYFTNPDGAAHPAKPASPAPASPTPSAQ